MIVLKFKNRQAKLTKGDVIHLKVLDVQTVAPGKWHLMVDDVTPLPGAEPAAYGCGLCGIVEEAKADGSLPEGWAQREFERGHFFVCSDPICQAQLVCRVCGCTNENACNTEEGPCHWVEPDLCSACMKEIQEMPERCQSQSEPVPDRFSLHQYHEAKAFLKDAMEIKSFHYSNVSSSVTYQKPDGSLWYEDECHLEAPESSYQLSRITRPERIAEIAAQYELPFRIAAES